MLSTSVYFICSFFFFKQKTAYEMRISDWSSDVCSSDLLADPAALIKPPRDFDLLERQVMSGRPLIWSSYIYAWADGTPLQHLFGLGPESWEGVFKVYPHNTLVATLYELGWFGVAAMLAFWTVMFAAAASARGERFLTVGWQRPGVGKRGA